MHGLTDSQINKRAKEMGVENKSKQLERDARKHRTETDAALNLIQELRDKNRALRIDKASLEQDREEYGHLDEAKIAAIDEEISDNDAECRELSEKLSKQKHWPELSVVKEWIARQRVTSKYRPCVPEIKIPKGSTAIDELARIRAEVDAIRAAIRGVEIAWLPEEEALRKAFETIDKIAMTGAPDFRGLFRVKRTTYLRNE